MKEQEYREALSKARSLDMVDYLSKIGIEGKTKDGIQYWYLSPFHQETNPSFKVDRNLNRWYDHSEGFGGDLINFLVLYQNCTPGDVLRQIMEDSLGLASVKRWDPLPKKAKKENHIRVERTQTLSSYLLLAYLKERRIPLAIADRFCVEINYELKGKHYYGIGFKNDLGGYEIRNPIIKTSSSPKGITTIDNGAKKCAVFEGFFDMLSFVTVKGIDTLKEHNLVVLNAVAFIRQSLDFLDRHEQVLLYLDNDAAGEKFTAKALEHGGKKYQDCRQLYADYVDVNEWHKNLGKGPKIRRSNGM